MGPVRLEASSALAFAGGQPLRRVGGALLERAVGRGFDSSLAHLRVPGGLLWESMVPIAWYQARRCTTALILGRSRWSGRAQSSVCAGAGKRGGDLRSFAGGAV